MVFAEWPRSASCTLRREGLLSLRQCPPAASVSYGLMFRSRSSRSALLTPLFRGRLWQAGYLVHARCTTYLRSALLADCRSQLLVLLQLPWRFLSEPGAALPRRVRASGSLGPQCSRPCRPLPQQQRTPCQRSVSGLWPMLWHVLQCIRLRPGPRRLSVAGLVLRGRSPLCC